MAEVTGIIEEVVYRNEDNGFTVLEVRDEEKSALVTAVGSLPFANQGERVRISGQWTLHPDYGEQLKVENFHTVAPSSLDGMEKYLGSGLIKGVGPSTAKKLVEHFGLETIDIIQFNPDRLTEISGIGPSRAEMIASSFAEQKEVREVMIFLQTYGITTAYAVKIYKMYGADTIAVIRENPYRMAQEVVGIGFKTADRIASSMGIAHDSPYRIAAGTRYILAQAAGNGHTYLPKDELVNKASGLLNVGRDMVENAIVSLAINQSLFLEESDEHTAVYYPPFYHAEAGVCRALIQLSMTEVSVPFGNLDKDLLKFQRKEGITLAQQQKEAVVEALSNGVVVITGGPGTGKTTTMDISSTITASHSRGSPSSF
jgi:exodeoxyribonuclease V alpha subunit